MNEVLDVIKNRRSIRSFSNKEVEKEKIDKILEAGLFAASGNNKQSAIIIRVEDKQVREELKKLNAKIMGKDDADPFYNAPEVLIVLAKKSASTYVYDGSLVMGNMMLEVHEQGLGSCWIHRAKEEFATDWGKNILKKLGINDEYEGIGHLAIGYVNGDYPAMIKRNEGRLFTI